MDASSIFKAVAPYSKTVVAVGGAIVVTGTVVGDGIVSAAEAGAVATAWATAVGVFFKRNA